MKVKLRVFKEFDIKYIEADFGVRYFEDATVNGVEDNDEDIKMPCVVENNGEKRWKIKVDVDNGQIVNWDKGTIAQTYYKVCDDGEYKLIDNNGNVVKEINSYVPDIFAIYDEGFGDYVYLEIDENGFIKDWFCTPDLIDDMIKNDFNYEEDED